ncbi:MAG: hypothetical protein M3Z05_15070 [Gemmatimonadota bacterium]|nr:hypothetical protein [Gemmatimonadota bacterium]
MSKEENSSKATEPTALAEAQSRKAVPGSQHLPPVQGDQRNEPGNAGSPHHGQSGHAGSGEDADVQSIGQSQSDRAAGKSS